MVVHIFPETFAELLELVFSHQSKGCVFRDEILRSKVCRLCPWWLGYVCSQTTQSALAFSPLPYSQLPGRRPDLDTYRDLAR